MELFTDKPGDEGLPGRERCLAMFTVMICTTMAVFDGAMVNIALPRIAGELQVGAGEAVWIVNGYLLTTAMTLAIFSALAVRTGFRLLFSAGVTLFTLASLGCALSGSLEMLVVMRLLQGIGGAATLSIAPAILRSIFPNRLLGRILGVNALLIATSTALAPVLGGAMLSAVGWPWLFAINIPPGVIALLLALRTLPDKRTLAPGPFDVAGALWSATMLGAVIMASTAFSDAGTQSAHSLITASIYGCIALTAGVLFVRRQQHAPQPLLPLTLFSSARFSLAALTSLASFISQGMTFVALPFLFQSVYGYSTFTSALLFTAWPVGIILAAPRAGRLADQHSPALISTIGLVIFTGGLILLALLPDWASWWDISLRALICGIGFGTFQSPNNREMLASASREHSSYASGVLAIMRTFGQCLGAALVGVIFSVYAGSGLFAGQEQAVKLTLWLSAAATLMSIIFSIGRLKSARESG
ncbi:MFS transporter [Yokenella regensburgei]|uniref:MFS transporter n=1 Tax=Yokenella regensburgei TaxID=158877 RepID=UPI003F1783F9